MMPYNRCETAAKVHRPAGRRTLWLPFVLRLPWLAVLAGLLQIPHAIYADPDGSGSGDESSGEASPVPPVAQVVQDDMVVMVSQVNAATVDQCPCVGSSTVTNEMSIKVDILSSTLTLRKKVRSSRP